MKKKIAVYVLLFSSLLLAQNPDGKNVSLHITPLWKWGSDDYSQTTTVWYPNSLSSVESVESSEKAKIHYPLMFGISTQMKIPTTSFLTLTLSYSFDQHFGELSEITEKSKYFYQYWKLNGAMNSVSITLSLYNIFSVYQE